MDQNKDLKQRLEIWKIRILNLFRISNLEFRIFKKRGFTLIETIVSLGIITMAVVGPVFLINRSLYSISFSKNKILAVNLAQEGVELVRTIRENNVLCIAVVGVGSSRSWDSRPTGGGSIDGNSRTVDVLQSTALSGCPFIQTPTLSGGCSSRLNINANGVYTYSAGTPTSFRRCVDICVNPPAPPGLGSCGTSADSDLTTAGQRQDQMDVISTVTWTERGRQKSVTARERLYNWR